jgi:hypothetical protein
LKDEPEDDQLYKIIFKRLLEAEADGIIPYLVPGVRLKGTPRQAELNIDPLIIESPTIRAILAKDVAKARAEVLAKSEAEGKALGFQIAILDLVSDRFPDIVVSQVQQTIATTQDIERLKKFHHQVARTADEEEVSALLTQCFPPQQQIDPQLKENPDVMAIAAESEAKGQKPHMPKGRGL